MAQAVKRLSTMRETQVWSLGWEDHLEKEMVIHSSTIAWKIPWTEEPVGYSPWGRRESDATEPLHFTVMILMQNMAVEQGKNAESPQTLKICTW